MSQFGQECMHRKKHLFFSCMLPDFFVFWRIPHQAPRRPRFFSGVGGTDDDDGLAGACLCYGSSSPHPPPPLTSDFYLRDFFSSPPSEEDPCAFFEDLGGREGSGTKIGRRRRRPQDTWPIARLLLPTGRRPGAKFRRSANGNESEE